MKYLLKLILLLAVVSSFLVADEEDQVKKLAITLNGFETVSEQVWPGFNLNDSPTLVHFKNGHAYAFRFPALSSAWTKKTVEGHTVFFKDTDKSLTHIPLHPNYTVEQTQAFVYSMDHSGQEDFSLLTLVHERFHTYQFQTFKKWNEQQGRYLDAYNLENLAMMELEIKLLTQFLSSHSPQLKEKALKNYVAVSSLRRKALQPSSLLWEDHQQKMEGTADYVSLKTFQQLDVLNDFQWEEKLLEMRQYKSRSSFYQDITLGRNYFVGATLGFALDFCEVRNWKTKVAQCEASLQQLLTEALPLNDYEKRLRLQNSMEEFDYRSIKETFRQKMEAEQKQLRVLEKSFQEQEGIPLSIGLPKQRSSAGGRHDKSFHFGQQKILINESSTALSQDERWKLTFEAQPLLFVQQDGSSLFKIPAETLIKLDGRILALSEVNESLYFTDLSLSSPHCKLITTHPGRVYAHERGVSIEFIRWFF